MIETQVLMEVSDFSGVFLGIISWKIGFTFQREGSVFQMAEGFIFKWCGGTLHGEGIGSDGGGFEKNCKMGRAMGGHAPLPTIGNPVFID